MVDYQSLSSSTAAVGVNSDATQPNISSGMH